MRKVVEWFGKSIMVSALLVPPSLAGQTTTREDLVGTWALSPVQGSNWRTTLTLRADSTWTRETDQKEHGIEKYGGHRWSVAGDSLWLADGDPVTTDTVFSRYFGGEIRLRWRASLFKLEDSKQRLLVYDFDDFGRLGRDPHTYSRASAAP